MTYRELLKQLSQLSAKQLEANVFAFDTEAGRYFSVESLDIVSGINRAFGISGEFSDDNYPILFF